MFEVERYKNIKFEEFDDFLDKVEGDELKGLTIEAHNLYVRVVFQSFGVRVYVSESSSLQLGLVAKIREIVNKRERKFYKIFLKLLPCLPIIGAGVLFGFYQSQIGVIAFGAASFCYPLIKYQVENRVHVLKIRKSDELSFFKRKKDEIILALSTLAIGALISFLFGS